MNYRYAPGVKYIAGVTFQSEYGIHEAGSEVKEAEKFQNLDVLVSARFLWPYAPNEGYDWLPPHIFNSVKTRDEVLAELRGDPVAKKVVPQFPATDSAEEDEKPQVIRQAEAEADAQLIIREEIKAAHDKGPSPEEVAQEAVKPTPPAKKTAAKTAQEKKNV